MSGLGGQHRRMEQPSVVHVGTSLTVVLKMILEQCRKSYWHVNHDSGHGVMGLGKSP